MLIIDLSCFSLFGQIYACPCPVRVLDDHGNGVDKGSFRMPRGFPFLFLLSSSVSRLRANVPVEAR
jgi:hypothetical protein